MLSWFSGYYTMKKSLMSYSLFLLEITLNMLTIYIGEKFKVINNADDLEKEQRLLFVGITCSKSKLKTKFYFQVV